MPTAGKKTRPKGQVGAVILTVVVLMIALGGVSFYMLGKVDPQDTATAGLPWGDRVERRLDAIIDGRRPPWTDRLERRMESFLNGIGWD